MSVSAADRKRQSREPLAAAGIVSVTVEVPVDCAAWVRSSASVLRNGGRTPDDPRPPLALRTEVVEKIQVVTPPPKIQYERIEVPTPVIVPGPVRVERVEVGITVPHIPWQPLAAILGMSMMLSSCTGWWMHRLAMPTYVCADQPTLWTDEVARCTARLR